MVGPAVNEAEPDRVDVPSVDRKVMLSSDFAASRAEAERRQLVSVGRFALRGVGRAQELFTLDPELAGIGTHAARQCRLDAAAPKRRGQL